MQQVRIDELEDCLRGAINGRVGMREEAVELLGDECE